MTMTAWTEPAYNHITSRDGDNAVTRVDAALEALDEAFGIAVADIEPDPESGFDPARGSTPIAFALLDLRDLRQAPSADVDFPAKRFALTPDELTPDEARAGIRELLLHTADVVLAATDDTATSKAEAALLADIMGALATSYQWTFGTPW